MFEINEEYFRMKEELEIILEENGFINLDEKIKEEILYEFSLEKEDYEIREEKELKPTDLKYTIMLKQAIIKTFEKYKDVIIDDVEDTDIEDDYSEESDAQIRGNDRLKAKKEEYIVLDDDSELEEIHRKGIDDSKIVRSTERYLIKDSLLDCFTLLLYDLSALSDNETINNYLMQNQPNPTKENVNDKYYLLVATLLFTLENFFNHKRLDSFMEKDYSKRIYDGLRLDDILYLDTNDIPLSLDEPSSLDYYERIAATANDKLVDTQTHAFKPNVICQAIRNAFAHHEWNLGQDGRIQLYKKDKSGPKTFNIAIDSNNLDILVTAILEEELKDKFKVFYKYYEKIFSYTGWLINPHENKEIINEFISDCISSEIITEEEIKGKTDDEVYRILSDKIVKLISIRTLSEYIEITNNSEYQTFDSSFVRITAPNPYNRALPSQMTKKYKIEALINTITNTYFVHMGIKKSQKEATDFSALNLSKEYIRIYNAEEIADRDRKIKKHEDLIKQYEATIEKYKNDKQKVAKYTSLIERQKELIEENKATCEKNLNNPSSEVIFNHIRNSCAHGRLNIYFDDPRNPDISNAKIYFEDKDETGKLSFKATIHLTDLLNIMLSPYIDKNLIESSNIAL